MQPGNLGAVSHTNDMSDVQYARKYHTNTAFRMSCQCMSGVVTSAAVYYSCMAWHGMAVDCLHHSRLAPTDPSVSSPVVIAPDCSRRVPHKCSQGPTPRLAEPAAAVCGCLPAGLTACPARLVFPAVKPRLGIHRAPTPFGAFSSPRCQVLPRQRARSLH